MLNPILKKIFGVRNERVLRSLRPLVQEINKHESKIQVKTDIELRECTEVFKQRISNGESLDSILPEAFAVVREAAKRVLGMRHFDVQLIGGIALHRGMIAEMRTGEGKTLVATLPAYLNALSGKGVHVVTVNDYLAKRDSEWMGKIHRFLGLEVGVVYSGMEESEKKLAYAADITYGQNNEFGFDYLRDNMKYSADALMQRGHNFAIVDEVDSILIDEARTPLIISGPAEDSSELYYTVNKIIPFLKEGEDYEVDLRTKNPTLNEKGIAHCEQLLEVENLYDPENIELIHHVNQALRAHKTMERDVDYVVMDGKIVIVDDFTGRLMPGRRWSDGLHQSIEAKEGLHIAEENQTLASITFQNLFRLYDKLSGMTGTADTEAAEFKEIYKLDVLVIPTNRPMQREDKSDLIFRNRVEKYQAVADDIVKIHGTQQPILVGTISIEQSEALSRFLTQRGIRHNVLNAKHHEREAEIVSQAGRLAALTIATNMAGRGTDIVLGGNPEGLAQAESGTKDEVDPNFQQALLKYKDICQKEKEKVIELGGLYIIGTERHESRRIDNQLRGRAGRQGDPGKSRFYVSLEDDLMKRFGGEKLQSLMTKLGWEEGAELGGKWISGSIESAQKKVERFHFEARKQVTEYDDVMNKQRQVVYNLRNRALFRQNLEEEVFSMIEDLLENQILAMSADNSRVDKWDLQKLAESFKFLFNSEIVLDTKDRTTTQQLFDKLRKVAKEVYVDRKNKYQEVLKSVQGQLQASGGVSYIATQGGYKEYDFDFTTFEQDCILERLDHFWNLHLQGMDQLRDGIGLRGYAQQNPKHEYQKEGFLLFSQMLDNFRESVIRKLFYADVDIDLIVEGFEEERARRAEVAKQIQLQHESTLEPEAQKIDLNIAKDPNMQKAKLEQQRKERRKLRSKHKK